MRIVMALVDVRHEDEDLDALCDDDDDDDKVMLSRSHAVCAKAS